MVDGSTEAEYNDVVRTVKDRNLTTGVQVQLDKNYNMRVVPVVVIKRNNVTIYNKNVEGTGTPGTSK